jgi:hydrogenase nickel incorporation protein HypA/HybF
MHELSVTENLLSIATEHARKAGAARVTSLRIVMGQLSTFIDDSVQFYWDIISQGTLCEGAKLVFERVPATVLCLDCNESYAPGADLTLCPRCSGGNVRVTGGTEFRLDSIDVETDGGEPGPPSP